MESNGDRLLTFEQPSTEEQKEHNLIGGRLANIELPSSDNTSIDTTNLNHKQEVRDGPRFVNVMNKLPQQLQDLIQVMIQQLKPFNKDDSHSRQSISVYYNTQKCTSRHNGVINNQLVISGDLARNPILNNLFYDYYVIKLANPKKTKTGIQEKTYTHLLYMRFGPIQLNTNIKSGETMQLKIPLIEQFTVALMNYMTGGNDYTKAGNELGRMTGLKLNQMEQYMTARAQTGHVYVLKDSTREEHSIMNVSNHDIMMYQLEPDYKALQALFKGHMTDLTVNILQSYRRFPHTRIGQLLSKTQEEKYEYALTHYPSQIIDNYLDEIYDLACITLKLQSTRNTDVMQDILKDTEYKRRYIRKFRDTNPNSVNEVLREFTQKNGTASDYVQIHAHFTAYLNQGSNAQQMVGRGSTDLSNLDYSTQLLMLICTKWMALVLLGNPTRVSNSNAVLCLYGKTGTGKSEFINILETVLTQFRWAQNKGFQNFDVINAQMIVLQELTKSQLINQSYMKELLDWQDYIKVDVKNENAICVSKQVAVAITTNEDILGSLMDPSPKEGTYESNIAIRRRLVCIPFIQGKHTDLHKLVPGGKEEYINCQSITKEGTMNTLIALTMFHSIQDSQIWYSNDHYDYYHQIAEQFVQTPFGQFYLTAKSEIDHLITGLYNNSINDKMLSSTLNSAYRVGFVQLEHIHDKYVHAIVSEYRVDNEKLIRMNDAHVQARRQPGYIRSQVKASTVGSSSRIPISVQQAYTSMNRTTQIFFDRQLRQKGIYIDIQYEPDEMQLQEIYEFNESVHNFDEPDDVSSSHSGEMFSNMTMHQITKDVNYINSVEQNYNELETYVVKSLIDEKQPEPPTIKPKKRERKEKVKAQDKK